MKTYITKTFFPAGSSSGAYAINSTNEIVGYSAFSATEQRAAYKDGNSGKNKGWRILGVLAGGGLEN